MASRYILPSPPLPPVLPSCIFTIRFLYPSCNVPGTSSSFAYPFSRLPPSVGRTRPFPPKPSCHYPQAVPPPSLGLSKRQTARCQVGCRVWREPCWGWQERGGGVWCSSLWVGQGKVDSSIRPDQVKCARQSTHSLLVEGDSLLEHM
jgi:hypothetical protein